MQLFYSLTSPYARKVNMLLRYTGLINETELVLTSFESEELRAKNPLGKIPALIDGQFTLFESRLICEYIDDKYALEGSPSLYNRGIGAYYSQQKQYALATGILEAAVSSTFEKFRDTEHSKYWLERWREAMLSGVKSIEVEHCGTVEKPNISTFALAASLGYLDFRQPELDWRNIHGDLAEWFAKIEDTPWFIETKPPIS